MIRYTFSTIQPIVFGANRSQVITIILFVCLLFAVFRLQSQTPFVDSLLHQIPSLSEEEQIETYITLYKARFNYDLKESKSYAVNALSLANVLGNPTTIAQANNVMGIHFFQTSQFDSALVHLELARHTFEVLGESELELRTLNNMALAYSRLGKLDQALDIHMSSLTIMEDEGISGDMLASTYWNMGNLFQNLKKYSKANAWYRKAIRIYKQTQDTAYIIDLEYQIANGLVELDSIEEAEKIFVACGEYARSQNQPNALAGVLDHLGNIYTRTGQYDKAEEHLSEALDLALANGVNALPGQIYRRLSLLYLKTGNLKKAEGYAISSMENAIKYRRDKKLITDYATLSEIYEKQGKTNLALNYYKKYFGQTDSIFGLEKLNAINDLQTKYETDKKQQEINLLQEKGKREALQRKGLIGGTAILAALLLSLIYALRLRLIKNKVAKEKVDQELEFSQKELDHRQQELTAFALQLAHKNKVLEDIKTNVKEISQQHTQALNKIVRTIDYNQNDDESWEEFRKRFQAVHVNFESNAKEKYPQITANDLRLMSLLKMNLSSKEIAKILNISGLGIKKARYRLRKKLGLSPGDSLEDLVMGL